MQDVHKKLVQCMEDLNKPGLTTQQRTILRKKKHALRRRRQAMINGAKEVFYKEMEKLVQIEGDDGPQSTSGRREWAIRQMIRDAFQSRKAQRSGIVKISDSATNKDATDPHDRARIQEEYADEL